MKDKPVSAEERAAALDRLLLTYAMAVQCMRRLQREYQESPSGEGVFDVERAEREVDQLTDLHLTPTAM